MDARAIYKKSDKGSEAIASRSPGVAGKLRTLLILVDGKKTVEELVRLAEGLGESAQLLEQLDAEGLIERASAGTPAAASAPLPVAGAEELKKLKAFAARQLVELLGPMSDELCLKIEGARDLPQYIEVIKRAYGVVREVRGGAAADKFGHDIESQLPAA